MSDPATERYAAAPAPRSLRRVQSFLNTRSAGRSPEPDLLARPASANRWLRTLDWPATPRLRADDLIALRELRAALQTEIHAHDPAEPRAPQSGLAGVLENLRWRITLGGGELVLAAEGAGWQQIAGTLLSDVLLAQQHDLWPRLKPCRNPRCSVAFYDSSKNRSRVWHNTSACGNLINLRAARARRRQRST
jgi:predicted RNA-binding Zn ribbon-like protein